MPTRWRLTCFTTRLDAGKQSLAVLFESAHSYCGDVSRCEHTRMTAPSKLVVVAKTSFELYMRIVVSIQIEAPGAHS